jgi:hypothetical protein
VADAADDDLVVATGDGVLDGALQYGEHIVKARAAGGAAAVTHPFPGRCQATAGEVRGQVLLRRGEHIDAERPVAPDRPQRQAAEVETHQHQRRVEGQRGDGAGGRAGRLAVGADRRDHGDAGGEVAHGVPELRRRDPGGHICP